MSSAGDGRYFQIGDLVLDHERSCLLRNGELIRLEPRVRDLLVYLAGTGGHPVSRSDLMRDVWKTHVVDEAIHRAISLLRGALGEDARAPRLIETLPGKRYRFLATAAHLESPPPVQRPSTVVSAALAGLLAGALFGAAGLYLIKREPVDAPRAPATSPPTPRAVLATPAPRPTSTWTPTPTPMETIARANTPRALAAEATQTSAPKEPGASSSTPRALESPPAIR